MRYKPRPGVVLTQICGIPVLIPSRSAFDCCRTAQRLPVLWGMTWALLDSKDADEKIMQVHRLMTKRPDDEIRARLDHFYSELSRKGFLLCEGEEAAQ